MNNILMRDSGERQEFATGAVRDANTDKPQPHLISPFALMRLGAWLGLGAKKYAERNWEKGMPLSRCVASLFRHTLAYMMGKKDEDHAAAIMCNAMFIIHYEEMIKQGVLPAELADMPQYDPIHPTKSAKESFFEKLDRIQALSDFELDTQIIKGELGQ